MVAPLETKAFQIMLIAVLAPRSHIVIANKMIDVWLCVKKLLDTKKAETVGKFVCSFYFLGTYGLKMLFNIFSLGVANQADSRLSGREGIAWLTADAQPGDCLLFHYSGHGGRMPRSDGIWAANSRASLFRHFFPVGFGRRVSKRISFKILNAQLLPPLASWSLREP